MRLLLKLAMKFAMMATLVMLMGSVLRHGPGFLMKVPGMPGGMPGGANAPKFSSEESDLMSTVFQSALRLFSGKAKRNELASDLSDKLYAGRDPGTMAELGIELVKPGGASAPAGGAGVAHAQPGESLPAKHHALADESPAVRLPGSVRTDMLSRILGRGKAYSVELSLVPVAFLGMFLMHRIRRRRFQMVEIMTAVTGVLPPAESEPFEMKHAVHSLDAEDFESLVALIYQRQGYRVSMPAGLSGGRGGNFTLLRKSERVLVQCKNLSKEHRVPAERVRELQEAVTAAGATRGVYVVSCGFTWDARNFGKTQGLTLINGRTLDELITAARENPDEDLLAVSQWVPKLMSKVQLTTPQCPACGAEMEQLNLTNGPVWVCSQRPECRGRRSARKHQKPVPTAARTTDMPAEEVNA